MSRTLSQSVTVSFDYTRSTGPVIGRFLTGLREGVVLAGRTANGRTLVPPPEFDPETHAAITDFAEVGPGGVVTSWTWVPEPVVGQPFDRPFSWALVTFDGADCPMLLALDAPRAEIETGMRVTVRWADERVGVITDIACVVPESLGFDTLAPLAAQPAGDPVIGFVSPISLDYLYAASPEESAFFAGLAEGRLIGQRCPVCHKVYVPPRGACPVDGVPTTDEVELPPTGTITTFCIVNVPFLGQKIAPPYVSAYVLLDGADIAIQHLILDIPADEVRMGMRVEAVWRPRDEWGTTIENIAHFRPTGEPDADYETYKVHL
jgi:uncharacterized OB-fold protein